MPEAQKGEAVGLFPILSEKDYFKWYTGRFGDLGKRWNATYFGNVPEPQYKGYDFAEIGMDQVAALDYPDPEIRYQAELYMGSEAVEPLYYTIHTLARDLRFVDIIKITDVFTASEQSAFYGAGQQRLGLAQDRVMQYLRVINDMVNGLFKLVNELRKLDERISYYDASKDVKEGAMTQRASDAELSLKGVWIDLVEGGTKNPGSVFGLSQQLGFMTLPDAFFRNHRLPLETVLDEDKDAQKKRQDDLREKNTELALRIQNLEFNNKVKEVLARKLTQYYIWKDSTERELVTRRAFLVKYFRQYYNTIKLYMNWTRPYLKQARRLQMDLSKTSDASLIAAFEGSMVEIEIIAKQSVGMSNPFYACLMVTLEHVTQPKMSFAIEGGYHRGPIHTGRTFITWRGYAWTDKDIEKYKQYRESQDFELLADVNSTLAAGMQSVEGEIKKYLQEMGEDFRTQAEKDAEKKAKEKEANRLELITPIFDTFRDAAKEGDSTMKQLKHEFKAMFGMEEKEAISGEYTEKELDSGNYAKAAKMLKIFTYIHYKLTKLSYNMLTW